MEIEKKFLVKTMPENLEKYYCKDIEQGYLNRKPVVRIRRSNDEYILTYKRKINDKDSTGDESAIKNEEIEMALDREAFCHLCEKIDNYLIRKKRYLIPLENGRTAEMDVFEGRLKGLIFTEVEFPDDESARKFVPPEWFGKEVTFDKCYRNGYLSRLRNMEEFGVV